METRTLLTESERKFVELALARKLVSVESVKRVEQKRQADPALRGRSLPQLLCEEGVLDRTAAAALLHQSANDPPEAPTRKVSGPLKQSSPVSQHGLLSQKTNAEGEEPAPRGGMLQGGTRSLEPGARIGPYRIISELGRGGMGVVWRAEDERLRRPVALKTIAGSVDQEAIERFVREARTEGRIRHPGIVGVYSAEMIDGILVIALELVDGQSLAAALAQGPFPPQRAAAVVRDVALAVQAAHDEGVIHRDLKPGNVLLDKAGRPRLTDFGLARDDQATQITKTGETLGTPAYMSPEQALGKNDVIGPATDVYGLGAILFTTLTSKPPFEGTTGLAVLRKVIDEDSASPSRARVARRLGPVPKDLETICLRCLEKAPDKRYASAAALADDLAHFINGEAIQARPITAAERAWRRVRRNRWIALLGLVSLVGLAALAGVAVRKASDAKAAQEGELKAKKNEAEAIAKEAAARKRAHADAAAAVKAFEEILEPPGKPPRQVIYDPSFRATEMEQVVLPGERALLAAVLAAAQAAPEQKNEAVEQVRRVARVLDKIGRDIDEPGVSEFALGALDALVDDPVVKADLKSARLNPDQVRVRQETRIIIDATVRLTGEQQVMKRARLTRAIESDPDCAALYFERSSTTGDRDQQLRDIDKAIELRPNYADAIALRAVVLVNQVGDYKSGIEGISRAIALSPQPRFIYFRATWYEHEGDDERALADYETQMEQRDGGFRAYLSAARIHRKRRALDKAEEVVDRLLKMAPDWDGAWLAKAENLAARGRHQEAIDLATMAMNKNAGYAAVFIVRARSRIELGQPEGFQDLDEALRHKPTAEEVVEIRALQARRDHR